MTIPPPINSTPPPVYQKSNASDFQKVLIFVKTHKLAVSITLAVIGWFLLFAVGCGQTNKYQALASLSTSEAQKIAEYTPVIKVVTVTPTETPLYTPTITPTATITPTPTNTLQPTATTDPLKLPFTDGIYLVNVAVAPGVWLSDGTADDCYWSINTMTGSIIDNHFGFAGGTMYVSSSAFSITTEDCGTWSYYAAP